MWGEQRSWGSRWKVLVAAVLAVLAVTVMQTFFVREAAFLAVDRRELSSGRRLLERVRNSWLPGSGASLLEVRAAMLDGDRETAERLLGALSGREGDEGSWSGFWCGFELARWMRRLSGWLLVRSDWQRVIFGMCWRL